MESLFELNVLLPEMKNKLISGTQESQMWVVEHILKYLKISTGANREQLVEKLVNCDIIASLCDAIHNWQITCSSKENFVRVVLECLEIMSDYKNFYKNNTGLSVTKSMIRISYCVYISLKNVKLYEEIVQGVYNILARSSKLDVDFDTVYDLQQIIFFLKSFNIQDSRNDKKVTFIIYKILNVVLQQVTVDEAIDAEIIDVSCNALKSMAEIVKHSDDNTILCATALLCDICTGSFRLCFKQNSQESEILQKKNNLSVCIYNTIMNLIIPYVKDADLSRIDSNEFRRNFVFCLNNLYQLENCYHDNLSNHLVANGYLKYFLLLAVEISDLRTEICILLSEILSSLSTKTFAIENMNEFAHCLRKDFLELTSKYSTKEQWNDAVASNCEKDGTILLILLYYHFQGTGENDIISLESLIARINLLSTFKPVSVLILKPLWFLFAVTSMSHPSPNSIRYYKNSVIKLTNILKNLEISKFYTHHIEFLRYFLKYENILKSFSSQVLDLWLIESDGDVKPLLPSYCEKVIRYLLIVIQNGYPKTILDVAMKGLCHLIQIDKNDKQIVEQIIKTVWYMLPNILLSYQLDTVTCIELVLELANITQPRSIPIIVIKRNAKIIANIILKKNTSSKFMTLIVTQAHNLLILDLSHESFEVLQIYIQQPMLLKELYVYGFSEERSELSTISIRLLTFIIYYQKKLSIKCKHPLEVHIKSLVDLLLYVRKSSNCIIENEMKFICELLNMSMNTENDNESAIVLQKISSDIDVKTIIYLYEVLHMIHAMIHGPQRDLVYQSLVVLLHFCNRKVTTEPLLLAHICTVMSTYYLIFNGIKTGCVSCQFVKFITTWLHYRKATCNDKSWKLSSLFKTPFDQVLDHLKEYSAMLQKRGLKDDYQSLRCALSHFQ